MTDQPEPYGAASSYYTQPQQAPLKDLTLTGTLSVALAGAVALFAVVNAISVERAIESDRAGDPDVWVVAYGLAGVGYFLCLVAGFVVTGLWTHAARMNAGSISPEWSHTRSAGWAWGGWIVPIVSFWFPFQVVRDVHRASARQAATPPLLGWWWGFWVAVLVLNRAGSEIEGQAFSGEQDAGTATAVAWFLALVTAVAAVLWGLTVRRVTLLQHSWMRGVAPSA